MKSIEVFYQGEQILGVEHLDLPGAETIGQVKQAIIKKHNCDPSSLVYVEDEDEDEPVSDDTRLDQLHRPGALKVHVHRCRKVKVAVRFNDKTAADSFSPSATVARVKKWAAEKQFGMTPEEAGEHVLQISGTQDRPAPGTHVGTLTGATPCKVEFDLVPDERVNGCEEELA